MLIQNNQNKIAKVKVPGGELFILRCADGKKKKQGIYDRGVFTTSRLPSHLFQKFNGYGMNLEVLHELQKDDEIHIKASGKTLKTTVRKREESGIAWEYRGEKQLILSIALFN